MGKFKCEKCSFSCNKLHYFKNHLNNSHKSELNKFYGQSGEDKYIFDNYINKKTDDGFFIELGAFDGENYSNTKFFEDTLNFKGILIEANPIYYKRLLANRPKSICIEGAVNSFNKKFVEFIGDNATGGILELIHHTHFDKFHKRKLNNEEYVKKVKTQRIDKLCEEHNVEYIDFFSIDVEGGELEVLKTVNWSIPVYIVLIELDWRNQTKNDKCRKILSDAGLVFEKKLHGRDEIWINKKYFRIDKLFEKKL